MSGQAESNGPEGQPPLTQRPKRVQTANNQLANIEEHGESRPEQDQEEILEKMADEEARRLYTVAKLKKKKLKG